MLEILQRVDLTGKRQRRAASENKAGQSTDTKHPNIITTADADYLLIIMVRLFAQNK